MEKNLFKNGFTLIELLVVVAIIAIMSVMVVFSGEDGRTRHSLQGAYETVNVAITQASVLSRSQQEDDVSRQNTHVVFSGTTPHTVGIYFDSSVGTAGEYDVTDLLEEEYLLKNGVELRYCPVQGDPCNFPSSNIVLTIPSSGSSFTKRVDGVEKTGLQYFEFQLRSEIMSFSINDLGITRSY